MTDARHTRGPIAYEIHPDNEQQRSSPRAAWSCVFIGPEEEGRINHTTIEGGFTHGSQDGDPERDARLLVAAYNAFDSSTKTLGIDAVECAERMANGGIAELFDALDYLLAQTVDMDLKHGITLTEGEEEARAKSLAIIAKLKGEMR